MPWCIWINLGSHGDSSQPWGSYGAGTGWGGGVGTLKALPRPLSLLLWSPAAVQGCPALTCRGPIPHTAGCFTAWLISTFWNRAQPVVSKERRQAEKGEVPGFFYHTLPKCKFTNVHRLTLLCVYVCICIHTGDGTQGLTHDKQASCH